MPHLRRGSVPCSGGVGGSRLRRAPGSLFRWGGGLDAPKSAEFPVPWSLARGAPKSSVCWTPSRPCARCSEERRLSCPGGRGSLPTRPWALAGSRWGAAPPKRSGSLSRWSGVPRLRRGSVPCSGEVVRAALRRVPVAVPRWNGVLIAPKSVEFPVPSEWGAHCSEERRVPCPGEVVRAALRRVPVAVPRWNRALRPPKRSPDLVPVEQSSRCSEERRLLCPGGRVPCRVERGTGVRRRGFNAMMLRSAEADPHVIEHTALSGAEAPVFAT